MKSIEADIRWLSHDEGGRKCLPYPGFMYYPHIRVDEINTEPWSVCFCVTPVDKKGLSTILFSLLVDNFESRCFSSKLKIGMHFVLLEGNKTVAQGYIRKIK